ncbi:cupin domain-containing protein [Sphingomonas sp.]|uniref:cupin domain-containing protein n=1 Tax=Sphingomonas sp. TaxID=28214 RepID=UPI002BF3221F|nr:cupin domain-containing protein [Sphingomonas sp.]HWK36065.1 cupin domain-containing protein [Sphingomonas sp.]
MTTRPATNLYADLPAAMPEEAFTELLARPGIRIERIVSRGQVTPADAPMVQDHDEWVLLLGGTAGLRIEDAPDIELVPGDCVMITRGRRHWVTHTSAEPPTLWLAIHLGQR